MDCINRFLDVMEFDSNASRTNAVAAFLTIPWRRHFPGGKPFILVSADKSHSGKTTVCEFMNIDQTATARIEYDPQKDWPMQNQFYVQLMQRPEIGIISFDNVRTNNQAKTIRSGYLESFVTSPEVVIGKATAHKARWTENKFVVMLNSNEGELSIDLLNRSLPIRLSPKGDVTQRKSPIGNPKLEYLPTHRRQIEAERWGMFDRWVRAGKPLDESEIVAKYPMGPWAKNIGGILRVNGFTDFLVNYGTTRIVADPIRQALSILAFHSNGKAKRAGELAKLAIQLGLQKVLLPGTDPANISACEREIGKMLSPYVHETFSVHEPSGDNRWIRITYRLLKTQRRWDNGSPHYRYEFKEESKETITGEPQGVILERPGVEGLPESHQL
jgi:hypothetical protein